MKKVFNYETAEKIRDRSRELSCRMFGKALKRDALSTGLIKQAANAKTEIDCINALANFDANLPIKGYTIIGEWIAALNRDLKEKIVYPYYLNSKRFTVGDYLDLIASKAPSEKDAFTNFDNAILA